MWTAYQTMRKMKNASEPCASNQYETGKPKITILFNGPWSTSGPTHDTNHRTRMIQVIRIVSFQ